ncbi:MAG: hypothetical protein ACR2HR_01125 [Euzebya sp.]
MSTICSSIGVAPRMRSATIHVRWDRVAALLVAVLAFAWFIGTLSAGLSQADTPAAAPVTVVIQTGDTVWDLARQYGPAGMATLEYAAVVESHNGVRAGRLIPGSVLELPQG